MYRAIPRQMTSSSIVPRLDRSSRILFGMSTESGYTEKALTDFKLVFFSKYQSSKDIKFFHRHGYPTDRQYFQNYFTSIQATGKETYHQT